MGSKANKAGADGLLAALSRAQTATFRGAEIAPAIGERRPRFWLCNCGNRLLAGDACAFHKRPESSVLRKNAIAHLTGTPLYSERGCRCSICERFESHLGKGATREQAAWLAANETFPDKKGDMAK